MGLYFYRETYLWSTYVQKDVNLISFPVFTVLFRFRIEVRYVRHAFKITTLFWRCLHIAHDLHAPRNKGAKVFKELIRTELTCWNIIQLSKILNSQPSVRFKDAILQFYYAIRLFCELVTPHALSPPHHWSLSSATEEKLSWQGMLLIHSYVELLIKPICYEQLVWDGFEVIFLLLCTLICRFAFMAMRTICGQLAFYFRALHEDTLNIRFFKRIFPGLAEWWFDHHIHNYHISSSLE